MGAGEAQTPAPEGRACCRCTTRTPAPTINGGGNVDISTLIQLISTLVSTVGFPIACTCALFYFWNREREEHANETKELKDAINNNALVMQKLVDKLGGDEN